MSEEIKALAREISEIKSTMEELIDDIVKIKREMKDFRNNIKSMPSPYLKKVSEN